MFNGLNLLAENLKSQIATDFTNSEQISESCDYQVFSIKEICPEHSNSSEIKYSPTFRGNKARNWSKFDDAETNLTNFQSRRITEEVKSSVGTSITEFRLATMNSPDKEKYLETFGCSPCTAYCGCCKKYVHTYIEYVSEDSNYFHRISQILFCCSHELCKVIVHRCPYCNLVLGKYGN